MRDFPSVKGEVEISVLDRAKWEEGRETYSVLDPTYATYASGLSSPPNSHRIVESTMRQFYGGFVG